MTLLKCFSKANIFSNPSRLGNVFLWVGGSGFRCSLFRKKKGTISFKQWLENFSSR